MNKQWYVTTNDDKKNNSSASLSSRRGNEGEVSMNKEQTDAVSDTRMMTKEPKARPKKSE